MTYISKGLQLLKDQNSSNISGVTQNKFQNFYDGIDPRSWVCNAFRRHAYLLEIINEKDKDENEDTPLTENASNEPYTEKGENVSEEFYTEGAKTPEVPIDDGYECKCDSNCMNLSEEEITQILSLIQIDDESHREGIGDPGALQAEISVHTPHKRVTVEIFRREKKTCAQKWKLLKKLIIELKNHSLSNIHKNQELLRQLVELENENICLKKKLKVHCKSSRRSMQLSQTQPCPVCGLSTI